MSSSTVELNVAGMSCSHCVEHVRKALEALPGATQISVDLENGSATVSGVDSSKAIQAIEEEGYQASLK
ncbi:MAG: heavy-metal-associated domain-containing protein [Armatimonadetes bacterium]|nr:heavy-metal-associated domain-containing protein [Armatimonadota bacterium]